MMPIRFVSADARFSTAQSRADFTSLADRVTNIEMRLDDMAVTIEERAVDNMTEDLAYVADELRKAVGDLARLLVRDRGRIAHILTEHRNAIIAEIRMPASDWEPSDLG